MMTMINLHVDDGFLRDSEALPPRAARSCLHGLHYVFLRRLLHDSHRRLRGIPPVWLVSDLLDVSCLFPHDLA